MLALRGDSAAIYLNRAGLDPLLLEEDEIGGLLTRAYQIENYPGFPNGITSDRLVELLQEHLRSVGGTMMRSKVRRISGDRNTFSIETSCENLRSRAVIVATGTTANGPIIEGSDELKGRRVFYDLLDLLAVKSTNDDIVVYGGGDAAFDQGLNLRSRGHDVTILCHSRAHCLPLLRRRANAWNINLVEGQEITKVTEGQNLRLMLDNGTDMETDRLLIACGRRPRLDILDPSLFTMCGVNGQVIRPRTVGLFLAGDVVANGRRQIGIAVGSGMSSAMLAERYLRGHSE